MVKKSRKMSLQTTITLLVCGVSIVCLAVTGFFIQQNIEQTTMDHIKENARNVSRIVALSPIVQNGLSSEKENAAIQPYAEKVRKATHVRFVVVMDMHKIRKSHPLKAKIGEKFVGGDEGSVFSGKEHISIAKGTLGLSLRAFTPVFNSKGQQIGAVAVGILLDSVEQKVNQGNHVIYFNMLLGIIIGLIGAIFLGRKVKKIMFGMEPAEIANLLEQRSAVLENAREGVIAIDRNAKINLVNHEANRLIKKMGFKEDPMGKNVTNVIPNIPIMSVVESGDKIVDNEYFYNNVSVVANIVPIKINNEITGAVATFRDKTEIKQMAEQLTGVRSYAEALRSQTHEFMNKLHVILGMVQMEYFDELVDFVKGITDRFQSEVGFITSRIKDPVIAGFLIGKISFVREKGGKLIISEETYMPTIEDSDTAHAVITIIGNLIDNSLDSLKGIKDKNIKIEIIPLSDQHLSISVEDSGMGMTQEVLNKAFNKGFSTKGTNRGVGLFLVHQCIKKLNGKINVCSEEGNGTRMNVILPYAEGRVEDD